MRKLSATLVAVLAAGTVSAQDLLQCLHPDVREGLARNSFVGVRDAEVTPNLPEAMNGIATPNGFEFIAASLGGNEVVAAFRSEQRNDIAHEAALAALEEQGWQIQGNRSNVYFPGDAGSPIPSLMVAACRDDRRVTVGSRDIEGTSYVNYHFPTALQPGACGTGAPAGLIAQNTGELDRFMPALSFPPDPATGQTPVVRFSGSGGGMNSRSSSARVTINMPIGTLASHLATELGEAGWAADSSWAGTVTAGSTWLRQPDPNNDLMGTLEITAQTPTQFELTFSISKLN